MHFSSSKDTCHNRGQHSGRNSSSGYTGLLLIYLTSTLHWPSFCIVGFPCVFFSFVSLAVRPMPRQGYTFFGWEAFFCRGSGSLARVTPLCPAARGVRAVFVFRCECPDGVVSYAASNKLRLTCLCLRYDGTRASDENLRSGSLKKGGINMY